MSLSRANKPRASAELSMQFSHGYSRAMRGRRERNGGEGRAKRAAGKNCSTRDRKLASPTYNRQGWEEVGFAFTRFEAIQFR